MPALIDSAPDCVTSAPGAIEDDAADFILQGTYEECAGFGTFMPGSTYGEEGQAAEGLYYLLTWLGIAFMVAALAAWVVFENRRLVAHVVRLRARTPTDTPQAGV
jgi:hypothetical protein